MNEEQIMMVMEAIMLGSVLLAIVYTIGVVWRVEQELDVAYKLMLASLIVFGVGELVAIIDGLPEGKLAVYIVGAKMAFSLLFLAGVFAMRDLIRKIDGEKRKK